MASEELKKKVQDEEFQNRNDLCAHATRWTKNDAAATTRNYC